MVYPKRPLSNGRRSRCNQADSAALKPAPFHSNRFELLGATTRKNEVQAGLALQSRTAVVAAVRDRTRDEPCATVLPLQHQLPEAQSFRRWTVLWRIDPQSYLIALFPIAAI